MTTTTTTPVPPSLGDFGRNPLGAISGQIRPCPDFPGPGGGGGGGSSGLDANYPPPTNRRPEAP